MLAKKVTSYNKFFDEINKGWAIITAGDKFIGTNSMTVSWAGMHSSLGATALQMGRSAGIVELRKESYRICHIRKSMTDSLQYKSRCRKNKTVIIHIIIHSEVFQHLAHLFTKDTDTTFFFPVFL